MKTVILTFRPNEGTEAKEGRDDPFDYLMGALINNGQISDGYFLTRSDDGCYRAVVTKIGDRSLDEPNCNDYVRKGMERLKDYSMTVEELGTDVESGEVCTCAEPSAYYLFQSWNDSPVRCCDCDNVVPLYRLPCPSGEREHVELIQWQTYVSSMSKLWIGSLWDRYTLRQLVDPESALNRTGRELCAEYEKAMGKPFYYDMEYDYNPISEFCPVCGKKWLPSPWRSERDLYCPDCRLMASKGCGLKWGGRRK